MISKNMVSFEKNVNGFYIPNGKRINVGSLKEILDFCKYELSINSPKGCGGYILAYNTGITGDAKSTNGVVFMDFDKVPRHYIDAIMSEFDRLASYCAPLLAVQPSYSYYHNASECGMHVYFLSLPFSGDNVANEYRECAVKALAFFCRCVYNVFNIDLRKKVDAHNTRITQKFFLNYADYKYNEKATLFTENSLTKDNWNKLENEYPEIFKEIKFVKNNTKNDDNSVKAVISKDDYVIIQCNSQRTDYPKHNERYPMVNARIREGYSNNEIYAEQLSIRIAHGGKESVEFKRNIYSYCGTARRGKAENLTQEQYEYGIRLLREFGRVSIPKSEHSYEIPSDKYLSHYNDLIINEFEKHSRILIQAPTGTGKTTLMKELAKKYNAVILVPFNSMLRLYEDVCTIVSSDRMNSYTEDRPVCMVWDRAMRYDLSNRVVISDETHQWFFDRQYRNSAVDTINSAKKWKRIICISATPAGEEEELNLHKLNFSKRRNTIPVRWVNSVNSGSYIKSLLDDRELGLNYIVFSDRHAMKMYQNFPEGCLLHSERRHTQEFISVIQEERLSNNMTFCTALAYNGLNFRNTSNYKVVIDVKEGEDTASRIIQAVGRLRNANIVEVIIVFTKRNNNSEARTVAEKKTDTEIIKKQFEQYEDGIIDYDERYTNQNFIDAFTAIEKFLFTHSSKENIIADLLAEHYFDIKEESDFEKREKVYYVERDKSNVEFKNLILENNGCIATIDYNELDDYQKRWFNKINEINTKVHVDWVRFINGRKMISSLDTLCYEVRLTYDVCKLTREKFEFYYSDDRLHELTNLRDKDGNRISDIGFKIIKKRFKLARKIRELYELVDEHEVDPISKVLDELMGIKEEERIKSLRLKSEGGRKGDKKGKSEGGRKGGLKGKSITIKDNKGKIFHFDTYEECRIKKLDNCSPNTFSNFLKGTSKYNKKYIIVSD